LSLKGKGLKQLFLTKFIINPISNNYFLNQYCNVTLLMIHYIKSVTLQQKKVIILALTEKVNTAPWHIKLKILRVLAELSTVEAANKCGVSLRTYITTEAGVTNPQPLTRRAICNGFGVNECEIWDKERED